VVNTLRRNLLARAQISTSLRWEDYALFVRDGGQPVHADTSQTMAKTPTREASVLMEGSPSSDSILRAEQSVFMVMFRAGAGERDAGVVDRIGRVQNYRQPCK